MTDAQKWCPKCDSQMEEGIILDSNHSRFLPIVWLAGKPEMGRLWGIKVQGKRKALVSTYRCVNCGYLESYAEKVVTEKIKHLGF